VADSAFPGTIYNEKDHTVDWFGVFGNASILRNGKPDVLTSKVFYMGGLPDEISP
jgi:hypothetical protein